MNLCAYYEFVCILRICVHIMNLCAYYEFVCILWICVHIMNLCAYYMRAIGWENAHVADFSNFKIGFEQFLSECWRRTSVFCLFWNLNKHLLQRHFLGRWLICRLHLDPEFCLYLWSPFCLHSVIVPNVLVVARSPAWNQSFFGSCKTARMKSMGPAVNVSTFMWKSNLRDSSNR